MGLMKSAKRDAIANDAQRAADEGRTVFVGRYWDEVISYQGTGSVSGAAEAIEAVEESGWHLAHMSYSWVPEKHRGVTLLLFRPAHAGR